MVTLVLPNQRRDMARMMATAGITAQTAQVRSGDAEMAGITGARVPTGIAVTIHNP